MVLFKYGQTCPHCYGKNTKCPVCGGVGTYPTDKIEANSVEHAAKLLSNAMEYGTLITPDGKKYHFQRNILVCHDFNRLYIVGYIDLFKEEWGIPYKKILWFTTYKDTNEGDSNEQKTD